MYNSYHQNNGIVFCFPSKSLSDVIDTDLIFSYKHPNMMRSVSIAVKAKVGRKYGQFTTFSY